MDYDHMLNGAGSRQYHQNMIREAQYNRIVKDAKTHSTTNTQPTRKTMSQQVQRVVLATVQLLVK